MNRSLLTLITLLLSTSALSGCSWYTRQADAIGSYMPTYSDWFGEDGDSKIPPVDPYQYSSPPQQGVFAPPSVDLPPAAPGDLPPPPPGFNDGPNPDDGLRRLQMQQQDDMETSPAVPFTEPVLENSDMRMNDMSATVASEAPTEESSGLFGFVGDLSNAVESWFSSDEKAAVTPYPNLGTIPATPAYGEAMAEVEQVKQELQSDHDAAQKQQSAIADWAELADDAGAAVPAEIVPSEEVPAFATAPIPYVPEELAPPAAPEGEMQIAQPESENIEAPVVVEVPLAAPPPEVVTAEPAIEVPLPHPIISIPEMEEAAPALETKAEYLRVPQAISDVPLLPQNRYSGRR